jgi:glutamate:GABA antiporter
VATDLERAEQNVEAHSASLKKPLGLGDLVLTQILFVVGSSWVGAAAKLGSSHLFFWLLAILLFYIPQAAVVIYLNRRMPLEGGIYQWAKLGFNEFAGFIVAWNLWLRRCDDPSLAAAPSWLSFSAPAQSWLSLAIIPSISSVRCRT